MKQIFVLVILVFSFWFCAEAQNRFSSSKVVQMHSHNDYLQQRPLLGALEAEAKSIEIDVYLIDGNILVGHEENELTKEKTLESLYILPLQEYLATNGRKYDFFFMIDVKSEAVSTLNAVEKILKKYPAIFSQSGVLVVISGNRPNPENYKNYASFIWFDGRQTSDAEGLAGNKVALISRGLSDFTKWRGEGEISTSDKNKLEEFVKACHLLNKPVRFWDTGDCNKMRNLLTSIGVDYLNTDNPKETRKYINRLKSK